MSEGRAATVEQPSRYDRSVAGLIVALLVTVVVVSAYVGFRAITREQPDVRPEPVDYLQSVGALQGAGTLVVYPRELPDGWIATTIDYEPGEPPEWGIGMLTDDGKFVGVQQQDAAVEDLVATYVDEDPEAGEDAAPENALDVASWQTWSDEGGDRAFTAEPATGPLAGQAVLVYGSASVADQEELIGLLTLDLLEDPPR